MIKIKLSDNEESEKLTQMDYKSIKLDNKVNEEMNSPKLLAEIENEKILFNKEKFNLIFLSYALMIIISLLKGSNHTKSIINIKSYLLIKKDVLLHIGLFIYSIFQYVYL